MKGAIILISGGLDSVVLAHYLKKIEKIKDIKLLFIDYGQKAFKEELFCVKKTARKLKSELKMIDNKWLGEVSTSLINKKSKKSEIIKIKEKDELISWYVPCRNSLFLLTGLALAEAEFISENKEYDVYMGIKYEGKLRFKDTTPEFIGRMNEITKFCTQKGKFRFIAPFLNKDKEEVIGLANKLKVNLNETYSCYLGNNFKRNFPIHCGICGGCKSRKKAFKFSEIKDPTEYGE